MRVRPPKKFSMVMNSGFCDNQHTQYYYEGTGLRCVGLEKKEKNGSDELTPKKKLKSLVSHKELVQVFCYWLWLRF